MIFKVIIGCTLMGIFAFPLGMAYQALSIELLGDGKRPIPFLVKYSFVFPPAIVIFIGLSVFTDPTVEAPFTYFSLIVSGATSMAAGSLYDLRLIRQEDKGGAK